MMRSWLVTAAAASLIAVAAAGCGTSPSAMKSSSSSGKMAAGGQGAAAMVLAKGKFSPKQLSVKAGTTVTLTFDGMGSDHFLVIGGGSTVKSPVLKMGGKWRYKFSKPGTYKVEPAAMTYIVGTVMVH